MVVQSLAKGGHLPPDIPPDTGRPLAGPPPLWISAARMILRILTVLFLVYLLHLAIDWTMAQSKKLEDNGRTMVSLGLLLSLLAVYTLLIATPFVPGVEIGLSLMLLKGADIVLAVYLATVLGLILAFLLGRLMTVERLILFFTDLRLGRICQMLEEYRGLSSEDVVQRLESRLQSTWGQRFLRSRYLMLALLINLPGNAMMGGGGGISLVAGLSRLFDSRFILLTYCLAVAPIPILVWLYGAEGIAP